MRRYILKNLVERINLGASYQTVVLLIVTIMAFASIVSNLTPLSESSNSFGSNFNVSAKHVIP